MSPPASPPLRVNPHFARRPNFPVASYNERAVLDLVRRRDGLTRAEITQASGLTAQSISRLVDALVERGFLQVGARVIRGRGQPSSQVRLAPDAAYCLGVSIMTDALSMVLLDLAGSVRAERRVTPAAMTFATLVPEVEAACDAFLAHAPGGRDRLFGAGFAVSGFFIGEGDRLNPPDALEDLAFVDLEEAFSSALRLPVSVENDGTAAAIGESLHGVGAWASSFGYLYFANGFGGGVINDGGPWRGAHGNAGEFSNILEPGGHDRPTLERLRLIFAEMGRFYPNLNTMLADLDETHPAVERWIEDVTPALQIITSAIAAVNDPAAIVFGGRLPRGLAERLIPRIVLHNSDRRSRPKPEPRLCPSETHGDAAAIGAASLLFKRHFFL